MSGDDLNLSHAAGQVVAEALQHTRTLFCPFCAVSFMFEFTLKDHLKAEHRDEIAKQLLQDCDREDNAGDVLSRSIQQCQHTCPFCNAAFNHLGLIPKHIGNYHGSELLQLWQQQSGNAERLAAVRQLEPSILYAGCSPGLSVWFQQMMSTADVEDNAACRAKTERTEDSSSIGAQSATISSSSASTSSAPKIKSILKKTPNKTLATTPLAPFVTIRRSKSDVVKRSLSARRELRFDPSTKHGSTVSPMSAAVTALSPRMAGGIKKTSSFKLLRNPFGFVRKVTGSSGSSGGAIGHAGHHGGGANKLITSTPIGLLDDLGAMDCPIAGRKQLDNWKATVRMVAATPLRQRHTDTNDAPMGAASKQTPRFQCALCKHTYAQNAELLMHLREQHRGLKDWLRAQFSCAGCQTTFYSNRHLMRHCYGGRCTAK